MTCSCSSISEAYVKVAVRIPKHKHPINDLLELLGRRWALRILWELRDEALPFRRLREACDDVSTSVLTQRLGELREAGIVIVDDGGAYALSPRGRELTGHVLAMDAWARCYLRGSSPSSRTARKAS
jgi:DNA-binding HxlR family transcriptional regulator